MEPLICSCASVSEAEVLAAIEAGAEDIDEVGRRCEAGTGCQSCHGAIRFMLDEQTRDRSNRRRVPDHLRPGQLPLFGSFDGAPVVAGSAVKKRGR